MCQNRVGSVERRLKNTVRYLVRAFARHDINRMTVAAIVWLGFGFGLDPGRAG